jgi:hypothetical protein
MSTWRDLWQWIVLRSAAINSSAYNGKGFANTRANSSADYTKPAGNYSEHASNYSKLAGNYIKPACYSSDYIKPAGNYPHNCAPQTLHRTVGWNVELHRLLR